jgi:glycosyltransferase involved in cell wall biosynthesis
VEELPRTGQQAERRALVADLVRTQAVLEARSEQLREIFASRWYRLARFTWRLRRGAVFRRMDPPRLAGEGSFAQPLDSVTADLDRQAAQAAAPVGPPVAGLASSLPREGGAAGQGGPRLLLAGHSLAFCAGIARRARAGGAAVREDRWQTHSIHSEEASAAALAWADVVHCEWCLGNAVWYSRNKRPGQRLVIRFHRMELDTEHPGDIDLEQVDAIVFVARHVLERACERWGWDREDPRFAVVPNGIDPAPLRLPKLPGAEHTLAAIGYVPRLKRLDRALDVLELLRRRDERYRLLVKGREPWELGWIAGRDEEARYYEDLRDRLERTPSLRDAVAFEPFDDDVAGFLRRAGWILSTSEVEGHSVALAEAMASGAAPVVLERPGAGEQYERRWVHAGAEAAAEWILAAAGDAAVEGRGGGATAEGDAAGSGAAAAEGAAARRFAERWSWERVGPAWDELLGLTPRVAAATGPRR